MKKAPSIPKLPSTPLPFGVYWGVALFLCLTGIGVSAYLAISHFRVHTDPGYQSFCAISKSINCDTVSQSPYSVLLGLPLAAWGVAIYAFMLLLVFISAAPEAGHRQVWTILFAAAFLCSLSSVGFAFVSAFFIGSWCILCVVTYGVNLLLTFWSWIIRKRFLAGPLVNAFEEDLRFLWKRIRLTGPVFGVLVAGLFSATLWVPPYWVIEPPIASAHLKSGLTQEGLPWVGSEDPELEIVEFTDYQCFQCRKMHLHMLQLLARHPNKIRVIHRHFPMDHEFNPIVVEPFHVGSGRMAILAIYAAIKGKFPQMNDWLFFKSNPEHGSLRLSEAAAAAGIDAGELAAALKHDRYRLLLKRDIHEGLRLGVVGTPSYLVNGKVYEGSLPAEALEPLFQRAGVK
jgi:uncharacterized membrane protein